MVYNGILMETIELSVMVPIGLLLFCWGFFAGKPYWSSVWASVKICDSINQKVKAMKI